MSDTFNSNLIQLTSPLNSSFDISPNDTNTLAQTTRGLYLDVAGIIKVLMAGDTVPQTFNSLVAGIWHPMRVQKVYASVTTATGIKGGY
jgi:hypothetical protein